MTASPHLLVTAALIGVSSASSGADVKPRPITLVIEVIDAEASHVAPLIRASFRSGQPLWPRVESLLDAGSARRSAVFVATLPSDGHPATIRSTVERHVPTEFDPDDLLPPDLPPGAPNHLRGPFEVRDLGPQLTLAARLRSDRTIAASLTLDEKRLAGLDQWEGDSLPQPVHLTHSIATDVRLSPGETTLAAVLIPLDLETRSPQHERRHLVFVTANVLPEA